VRRLPALPLIGGGQIRFQPVYVEDVVAGFAVILANPGSRGKIYEFGGPRIYTFKELLEFVCATIRARPLLVSMPFRAAEVLGGLLGVFPGAPITHDQIRLLKTDKVISGSELLLGDLGVEPQALETIALSISRPTGGRKGPTPAPWPWQTLTNTYIAADEYAGVPFWLSCGHDSR
jgi:hypothetical protein